MTVAEYFDGLAEKYGRTHEAADAGSQKALEARWKVMWEARIDQWQFKGSYPRILQVGCGHGNFVDSMPDYLWGVNGFYYEGVDVSAKQVANAVHGLKVRCANVLDVEGEWDVVMGQGLFYKQTGHATCQRILKKMWDLAYGAVVVTTILQGQGDELWFDIPMLLKWVKDLGCTKWTLRHDYLPNDVCLYLYK